jgi:hypothetical protein
LVCSGTNCSRLSRRALCNCSSNASISAPTVPTSACGPKD